MFCENCGKNYANVKYTQIINGEKKEMFLCDECSNKLGIQNFNIPIDISSFFSNFFDQMENENILPEVLKSKKMKCDRCDLTFEEFIQTGKLGCPECYSTFQTRLDPLLRNLHGSNRHVGRLGAIENIIPTETEIEESSESTEIRKLKQSLKKAIKEENYEEAAKLRDEIKKLEGEK